MINYKGFKIVESYPQDFTEPYICFVWDKGSHYKAHAYGKDSEDIMWGLGDTTKEAIKEAIDLYWHYENNQ